MFKYFIINIFRILRYSDYYVKGDQRYRTLTKAYGLKFEIIISGKVGIMIIVSS